MHSSSTHSADNGLILRSSIRSFPNQENFECRFLEAQDLAQRTVQSLSECQIWSRLPTSQSLPVEQKRPRRSYVDLGPDAPHCHKLVELSVCNGLLGWMDGIPCQHQKTKGNCEASEKTRKRRKTLMNPGDDSNEGVRSLRRPALVGH